MDKFNGEMEENKAKYSNGPISKRSITDCLCCLIFIAGIVGFVGASAYGWFNGDPKKLLIPWDSDGNGCGFSSATKDYSKLYWAEPPDMNLIKDAVQTLNYEAVLGILSTGICVKECPTSNPKDVLECHPTKLSKEKGYISCVYQMGFTTLSKLLPDAAV